ncbi:MAG: hypothetical protein DRH20_11750 [Deltaproteobacteria bacterium]|nr:MAG: hypothetical protein DRH20_11750 [Deltaproteobacteria bacterium]
MKQISFGPMNNASNKKPLLRWYDPALMRILLPSLTLVIRLWLWTCRLVRVEGQEAERALFQETGGRIIYVTWHQRVSFFIRIFVGTGLCVMVSQSRDGEYGTRLARRLGLSTVRGSSTRGGKQALRALIGRIKGGVCGGMLADGPRGPARVAKTGTIVLAKETGAPIVPLVWSADRCWTLNSWDRSLFPKPFARVMLSYGEPIFVPPETKMHELEHYRQRLEDVLNGQAARCDRFFGKERPWRRAGRGLPETGPAPAEAAMSEKGHAQRDQGQGR